MFLAERQRAGDIGSLHETVINIYAFEARAEGFDGNAIHNASVSRRLGFGSYGSPGAPPSRRQRARTGSSGSSCLVARMIRVVFVPADWGDALQSRSSQ